MRIVGHDPLAIELREWETATAPSGVALTQRDRQLVDALARGDGRLHVEELASGIRLKAASWIGVVRFEAFELRVVPKLVGGNLGVVEMLDYAGGIDRLRRLRSARQLDAAADGRLVDLLAQLLAEAAEQIIRDGLIQDYVTREETLVTLRGRLRLDEQVRRRFGQVDRLECRYDELESNTPDNQLIAFALGLARRVCRHPETRRRVARLHSLFSEAADPTAFDPGNEVAIEYSRRNERYRAAHTLAWLFVRRLAIQDLFSPGAGRSYAFLLDMNALFEQFVTRLLRAAFASTNIRVAAQRRHDSLLVDEATSRTYASVIPDVLLEEPRQDGSRRVPVDAKYKLYDEHKLDMGDIYQTFFYGYAFAGAQDHAAGKAVAYLVYPATTAEDPVRLRVRRTDRVTTARIRTVALDVPAALKAIREGGEDRLPEFAGLRTEMLPTTAATSG